MNTPKSNQENLGGAGRRGEMPPAHMPYQPPRIFLDGIHLGWEMHAPLGRTLCQTLYELNEMVGQRQPRLWLHYHKTWDNEPCGRAVPWVPCSPPGRPFPIMPFVLSVHVSPWTIHFQMLDKKVFPFLQHHYVELKRGWLRKLKVDLRKLWLGRRNDVVHWWKLALLSLQLPWSWVGLTELGSSQPWICAFEHQATALQDSLISYGEQSCFKCLISILV